MSAQEFELHVADAGIHWQGQRVSMKGVNWFGFETADFALHGLWCANMNTLLDFTAQHGFNAIRLPFSADLALNMDARQPGNIDYSANPDLQGLTAGQVMDRFVQACACRGVLVLLDLHRLSAAKDIPELWYDEQYPEAAVMKAWKTIVLRYASCWNVFGADLNNEPHGRASWGDGNIHTDWRLGAERLAAVVLEANPRLLIFVEGVERNAVVQPVDNCWWGGHCAAAAKAPVRLPIDGKLVYSPHVYGPDVFGQPYFNKPDFPSNMPDIWRTHFGFVKSDLLGPAVCPGEWGGWCKEGSKDEAWQEALANWFLENDITDSFYWCLNPNSGDTGGLLQDDWKTPNERKLVIIARAHPNPTKFPQLEVTPLAPHPEQCSVEASAETKACSGGPAGNGGQQPGAATAGAAAPAARAAAEGPLVSASIEVACCNSWVEGSTPCHQIEIKILNTGSAPATSMHLMVAAVGELQKCWNCVRMPDKDGCWCFDLPDWCRENGGLGQSSSIVLGFIVKGGKPSTVVLQH